jgi:hypothetical protein
MSSQWPHTSLLLVQCPDKYGGEDGSMFYVKLAREGKRFLKPGCVDVLLLLVLCCFCPCVLCFIVVGFLAFSSPLSNSLHTLPTTSSLSPAAESCTVRSDYRTLHASRLNSSKRASHCAQSSSSDVPSPNQAWRASWRASSTTSWHSERRVRAVELFRPFLNSLSLSLFLSLFLSRFRSLSRACLHSL